jgi:alpha-L-fucosidase
LQIPLAQYAKIAGVFDPTNFDAAAWVRVAQAAGMKYMIFTAKHHDGFAMFDSQCNDYNVVARTPWHRDPVKELAAACQKAGLKFGVYYSLGRDWADPDVPTRNGYRSNTWDYPDETNKVFARYFQRKVVPQVTELLTHYGPIAVLWFDTPERISPDESRQLVALVHKLQPECIINSRVGHGLGDYGVQEQKIPGGDPKPWETCMTLNHHWAYFLGDDNWKTPATVIRNLVDIASKGGNYLLDVGPTGTGVIQPAAIAILQQAGSWMKVNGESIYGTTASPLTAQPEWGRVTRKGKTLYLHVFNWPANGTLLVDGTTAPLLQTNRPPDAYLLAAPGRKLKAGFTTGHDFAIQLPAKPLDPVDTVIVLKF